MTGDEEGVDPRVREHAETIVDWSLRVSPGEQVLIRVDDGAHDLAAATAEAIGERGGVPIPLYASGAVRDRYLAGLEEAVEADDGTIPTDESGDPEVPEPTAERRLYEAVDKVLAIEGSAESASVDVDEEVRSAAGRAREPVREADRETPTMITVHPTANGAGSVDMTLPEYREFVYDAVLRDWEALAEEMDRLKRLLDAGSTLRVVAEDTDLRMNVEERTAVNSTASIAHGSSNLPSGEVFTAPADTEGEITFDLPKGHRTGSIEGARLTFEDGEVVAFSAAENEAGLAEILDTDPGASRAGEFGIGMNRGLAEPVGKILFDEKISGTVHLALGRGYADCYPDPGDANESAVHVDLLRTMGEGSRIEVDGEVIQRDGRFRWEDANR
jgi:aminopeptidase